MATFQSKDASNLIIIDVSYTMSNGEIEPRSRFTVTTCTYL